MHIARLVFLPQQANENVEGQMAVSGMAIQSVVPSFNIIIGPYWMLIG